MNEKMNILDMTNELTQSNENLEQKPSSNDNHPMSQILSNFVAQGEIKRTLSIKKMQSESRSPLKKQLSLEDKQGLSPKKKMSSIARRPNILNLKISGINMSN